MHVRHNFSLPCSKLVIDHLYFFKLITHKDKVMHYQIQLLVKFPVYLKAAFQTIYLVASMQIMN